VSQSVSVVVCTYNRMQWLTKCLKSLEEQDPRPDEVIVVDGPSTDGTRALLEKLSSQGAVRLVRQERLDGISAARNMGLAEAKGDIVCFIDDDAVAQPGWLASMMSAYSDPTVGAVGGPVCDMTGRLSMGRNAVSPSGQWFDESRNEDIDGLFPVMVGCNMSFRKGPLRSIGGFDPYFRFHQDETDACLGLQFSGHRIEYSEGAVVWHEWCEGSYRQDRVKWYLKLRYLWGRNNSYLVRKHFGHQVRFRKYCAQRIGGFIRSRAPRGIIEKQQNGDKGGSGVPRVYVAIGAAYEVYGLVKGWADGRTPKARPSEAAERRRFLEGEREQSP